MISKVLTDMAPIGMEVLKTSLQQVNVTGKTVDSISFVVDKVNNKLTYYGRPFIKTIEDGRGPRKQSAYGNFDTNLEEWLKAKGFQQKKSKSGVTYYQIGDQWFSAKSLAWKINKEGDKQFRSGQHRDIYSKAMEEFKEELIQAIKKDQKEEFKNKIKAQYK